MRINFKKLCSIKTRLTLITLAIFLTGFWGLSFYASRILYTDMKRQLGEQQFSAASFMAAQINQDVDDRFKALKKSTAGVTPAMLDNPADLQAYIEQRPILQVLFNAGVFVTRTDGTAIAEVPTLGRVGLNYMDRDHISAALRYGKATLGKPTVGKRVLAPSFAITVPIVSAEGKVIGAVAGATDLSKPNFLDKIPETHYGKTGNYLIVARQHRLIVTASSKARIMALLPDPGISPMIDRFIQGYEGTLLYVNPLGIEQLASVKDIPLAGWYVNVTLPTKEAFAPIRITHQRMLIATAMLTILAGFLIWWATSRILRRQLSPIFDASRQLYLLSDSGHLPQPLTISSQDEIGELIGEFNRLLETLRQREETIQAKNTELERFAYTVSHDLKSPLITIQSYAGMIAQDMKGGKYERAMGDMKRIEGAAIRMSDLLDDLLKLSRVGRQMNESIQVDMNQVVSTALEQLAGPLAKSQVEVVVQPDLPAVFGDHKRIAEVVQNLIENAIKYRGEQSAPRIEIGTRQDGEERVFFVRDNGAGIAPAFHEKVFGLFNKLDTGSEGTGVGLALVKRIIEVHGGRVWVESEGEGLGSCFCFTVANS